MNNCPVCHRKVTPTQADNVWRHRDKAGNNCPMSGKPFDLIHQTESDVA